VARRRLGKAMISRIELGWFFVGQPQTVATAELKIDEVVNE
jgi:hypothetical protein